MISVALLVSAWIEILQATFRPFVIDVALLVSAWIEITHHCRIEITKAVALLVSAWIEIEQAMHSTPPVARRTPRECVD